MPRTGRPRAEQKRSATLKAKTYETEKADFENACEKAKLDAPDVLRALAAAWVAHVKTNPRATLHIKIVHTEDEG